MREHFEGSEDDNTRKDFAQHPHAAKLRGEWGSKLEQARLSMAAAARDSADPVVRAEQARIDGIERFLAHLKGGELA